MERNSDCYRKYVDILKRELLPAMGCTEPIAVSYAAARAKELLGALPERMEVKASGNIIKNVKSVIVPNTGGLKGLETAAAAGAVAGRPELFLEVISQVTQEQKKEISDYLDRGVIQVGICDSDLVFDLVVNAFAGEHSASVRIVGEHTNIVHMEKDGKTVLDKPLSCGDSQGDEENQMTVEEILDFASTCCLEDVEEVISRQIEYNTAIADEGLKNNWGANVGKVILKYGDAKDVRVRAKARAAAGSDARMSGCELPVVINSGSGNQGITASIPVIEYAKELKSTKEELYRALVLSNLLGLHQKAGIGRLSAYCGAVSAGCAAGAGIMRLRHKDERMIRHMIVNCLAVTSGIICDGAKPSCAAKIAAAIDAAFLAMEMAEENQQFKGGEGIVKKGIENTIGSVARLGKEGMRETDREILRIMVGE